VGVDGTQERAAVNEHDVVASAEVVENGSDTALGEAFDFIFVRETDGED